jgi:predicted phosphodiesterase
MRILITGDVHMEFGFLNSLINRQKPDMVICCGDFGYWPKVEWGKPLTDIKLQTAEKLLWCDGNHEDHWSLRDRETDELAPNIIYMPRGSTYTLPDGRTILFMGGADSIDKQWRRVGVDWFPEEIITQKDFQNLPDKKIDIFITHTCPEELVEELIKFYPAKKFEPSNRALSELRKIYKPDLWFFGHWHHYREGVLLGTQWYALSAPGFGDRWWMWLPKRKEG